MQAGVVVEPREADLAALMQQHGLGLDLLDAGAENDDDDDAPAATTTAAAAAAGRAVGALQQQQRSQVQ